MFNRKPVGRLITPNANEERTSALDAGNCIGAVMAKRPTKQALVLSLLQGEGGVPLTAIVDATGWLPHTARAALTGLRKKRHAIVRTKVESETRYMILAATK